MIETLRVVRPVEVSSSMLLETNVPENDYEEYLSTKPYDVYDRVITAATHEVWESVVANNLGVTPGSDPKKWKRVGVTNPWKAFDKAINTQTKNPYTITYKIRSGIAITSISALNLTAASLMRVRVVDPTFGVLFDSTKTLGRRLRSPGWWSFWFGERSTPAQALFMDVPGTRNSVIEITVEGGESLAVGVIVIGPQRKFGTGVKYGASVGIQDYSVKTRTEFGDLQMLEGPYTDRASFTLSLAKPEVDSFKAYLKTVRAVSCLWVGPEYEALTVYGPYKDFGVLIKYHDYSECELDLESLI